MPAPNRDEKGLKCPKCWCRHFYTIRTRPAPGDRVMRVRECRNCGRRVVTYEALAGTDVPEVAYVTNLSQKERESLMQRLMKAVGLA